MVNKKKVTTLSLDIELLDEIENQRDGIPRSAYINQILKELLKGGIKDEIN